MGHFRLLPLLFLFSCAAPGKTGYLITDYDSKGDVEKTYLVQDYDISGDEVKFVDGGAEKSVRGSFKIERLTNN